MHFFRHAGRDPASRRRPDKSREPSPRLDPGFHREPWIPAFAGMTTFGKTVSLYTDSYQKSFHKSGIDILTGRNLSKLFLKEVEAEILEGNEMVPPL